MSVLNTTELHVDGMTCNNCARKVTEAAQAVAGVHSVGVSVAAQHASVRWDSSGTINVPAVLAALTKAGYEAEEISAEKATSQSSGQIHWHWNLVIGLSVTGGLMAGEWIFSLAMTPWFRWTAFLLASVVQIYCGAEFYRGAWRQLKAGQSNMDTLVALGSTTAYGFSCWVLFSGQGGHVFFMEAAAIISLISFGHWLESRVSDRAGSALKSLLQLAPRTARKIHPEKPASQDPTNRPFNLKTLSFSKSEAQSAQTEVEIEVPISELKPGDRVALRPGDRVPVDGLVLSGESAVDEAMLTGESVPADKKAGSELFAGTVNLNGRLILRVGATGTSTALAHVIAAVQRAQTSRANIQRLGDRISNIFVPVIVGVALAAGTWWGFAPDSANQVHHWLATFLWHAHPPAGAAAGFIIAAAVLIVACPCAMGLATPAAIMASANAAARRGILIRDGVALEKAGTITAILFDKTGTLTEGKPEVMDVFTVGRELAEVKALAAALAKSSTHPISQAIGKSSADLVELQDWKEIRGAGVEGKTSDTKTVRLGSVPWLKQSGVALSTGEKFISEWSGQGATIVGLAVGDELAGLFAIRDRLKANAATMVGKLQQRGLEIYLVSGDNWQTATSIARQAGIAAENVFAESLPEQKAELVKKLQAQGKRVAFVGDGINDAPALSQADLGIAVSRASDIAREAADIILLKSGIEAVPEALDLARATLRTIKQNLFWAFFYNALGVPLAALGFISPVVCAAAMGVSDLIVIGNALRLLRRGK
jgi:Cu+-exporting ATPase